jgi:hypothetical protein
MASQRQAGNVHSSIDTVPNKRGKFQGKDDGWQDNYLQKSKIHEIVKHDAKQMPVL